MPPLNFTQSTNNMFSDAELIQKIRSTDISARNAALKFLYNKNEVKYTLQDLVRQANYRPDADDILQEAMILLDEIVREGRFQGNSSLTTFLLGICKNLIRNKIRTAERLVLQEEITDSTMTEKQPDAHRIMELSETEAIRDEILRGLLAQLTTGCQEAFKLYYYEACNMAQVAIERGLKNANQAGKTIDRCRGQLREMIAQQPHLINHLKFGL